MPWECFGFDFALVHHVAPLCWQWSLAQLFPAALAGRTGQCSVYLSYMSINVAPLCWQWSLAQLFPAASVGRTGQCLVYLS